MTGKDMTDSGSEGAKQRWMCMVDHNGGPCPGHPNFPDKKSAANNTERCDICALPLEGTMIGNGDGSGQRFAHPECYYRQRCVEIEKRNSEMTERVKELEIEREAARNEIQYLNGICDSEIGQKEKMQSQLDAANKRNEQIQELSDLRLRDLHKYWTERDKCHSKYTKRMILYSDSLGGVQVRRDDLWAVSTEELNILTRQLDKQGQTIKLLVDRLERYMALCKHECVGFCPDHAAIQAAAEIKEDMSNKSTGSSNVSKEEPNINTSEIREGK